MLGSAFSSLLRLSVWLYSPSCAQIYLMTPPKRKILNILSSTINHKSINHKSGHQHINLPPSIIKNRPLRPSTTSYQPPAINHQLSLPGIALGVSRARFQGFSHLPPSFNFPESSSSLFIKSSGIFFSFKSNN